MSINVRRCSRPAVVLIALVSIASVGVPTPQAVASTSDVDVNFAEIVFNYEDHTNITPADPDCSLDDTSAYCVGKDPGDIVRFNNVVTVGGVSVDAVIETLAEENTRIRRYEVSSTSKFVANPTWFWTNLEVEQPGGVASFRLSFYEAGTYTGPGTGTQVTLRNVRFTAADVNDSQFAQFSPIEGYALTTDTELTFDPVLGRFTSSATEDEDEFPWRYQAVLTYSSVTTLTMGYGAEIAGTANFGLPGLGLAFDGGTVVNNGPLVAETPAPLAGPASAPTIGFTTTPATDPADWEVLPTCGVYLPGGTEPLTGTLEPGTYLTRCVGGTSATFVPTQYIDGELVVTGTPSPAPTPATPKFTG
jgi:hypothetical protein